MQLQFLHKTTLNSFAFSVFSYTLQAESTAVSFPPPLSKSLRGRPPAACRSLFLGLVARRPFSCQQRQKWPSDVKATAYTAQTIIILLRQRFRQTMSRIIYCSDVVLRVDDPEADISNITRWIHESTEFRPAYPEGCVLRQEVRKRIRKYSSSYFG